MFLFYSPFSYYFPLHTEINIEVHTSACRYMWLQHIMLLLTDSQQVYPKAKKWNTFWPEAPYAMEIFGESYLHVLPMTTLVWLISLSMYSRSGSWLRSYFHTRKQSGLLKILPNHLTSLETEGLVCHHNICRPHPTFSKFSLAAPHIS